MDKEQVACECGCGTIFDRCDKYGRSRRYISGHNGRQYVGEESSRNAAMRRYRKNNPKKAQEAKRRYYRKRKIEAMELFGSKCFFCGLRYDGKNGTVFAFHHEDPTVKEGSASKLLMNNKWEEVVKELKKCVLACANCHSQHHGGEW